MNSTINLSQLIQRLAKITDTDVVTARRFIRATFATIEQCLVDGEEIYIKHLGTFRKSSDVAFGAPDGVIFIPDATLADEINKPFAVFKAVELADGLSEEELNDDPLVVEAQTSFEDDSENEVVVSEQDAEDTEIIVEQISTESSGEDVLSETSESVESSQIPQENTNSEVLDSEEDDHEQLVEETSEAFEDTANDDFGEDYDESASEEVFEEDGCEEEMSEAEADEEYEKYDENSEDYEYDSERDDTEEYPSEEIEEENRRSSKYLWLWVVLGIIIAGGVGYVAAVLLNPIPEWDDYDADEQTDVVEEPVVNDDSQAEVPVVDVQEESTESTNVITEQSQQTEQTSSITPEPIYEVVSSKNYLATMARRHYGVSVFWVYIYDANSHLTNPNQIKPGTRVLIPPKSSILANCTEEEALERARQRAEELLK